MCICLFACLCTWLPDKNRKSCRSVSALPVINKRLNNHQQKLFFLRNHKMMIKSMTCHFKGHKYLIEPVCFSPVSKWPDSNQFNRKFLAHYIMPNVRASNLGHCWISTLAQVFWRRRQQTFSFFTERCSYHITCGKGWAPSRAFN